MDEFKEDIINSIIKEAEGKLAIFNPKEKEKPDLVIKKKADYKSLPLNIRIETTDEIKENNQFTKDIPLEEFSPKKNFYLIFAYFDSIEREINDYVWLIPSSELEKLGEEVDKDKIAPKIRFKSSLNPKEKNDYTPFLIKKEDLTDTILKIVENPEEFEFSDIVNFESKKINLDKIKQFIAQARENTYAGSGRESENTRLLGSSQYEFQKANLLYRDIYFGRGYHFIGQEVIYQDNKPIWSMVYMGKESPKELTDFLKKALAELSDKCRLGEGCEFEKGNYKYQDRGTGGLENFNGEEIILDRGKQVYSLKYMGGLLTKEA